MLAAAVLGLFLFRGREFGDFLAVGMGLVAGGTAVIAIRPRPVVRLLGRNPRSSASVLRAACTGIALYLAVGMLAQGIGKYLSHRTSLSIQTGNYSALVQDYSRVLPLLRGLRPFTFYLDGFDKRAPILANTIHEHADRYLLDGEWRDAASAYEAVVWLDPNRIAAHGNRGTALLKGGQFWEAAQAYLRVLEHDPNDLIALYHLAVTQVHLKQYGEAVSLVRRILDIDTVGNAYVLISENPVFQLLETHAEYRRSMAAYALTQSLSTRE